MVSPLPLLRWICPLASSVSASLVAAMAGSNAQLKVTVSLAMSVGFVLLSQALGPKRYDPIKYGVYECGVDPATPDARESYSIRFYLLTLVFVIFEVETFLLFPWAVAHDQLGLFGLVEVGLFLLILVFGYIYAWQKKVLEWK